MNRAERRRQEREQRKNKPSSRQGNNPALTPPSTMQTEPSSRQESNPCPDGHPEQSAAFMFARYTTSSVSPLWRSPTIRWL